MVCGRFCHGCCSCNRLHSFHLYLHPFLFCPYLSHFYLYYIFICINSTMSIFVSLLSVFTYLFVLIPVYRFSFRFYLYYIFICFNSAISTFVLLYLHSFHFICIYAIFTCVYFTFINIHFILICSVSCIILCIPL